MSSSVFNTTREAFFLLAPLESLRDEYISYITSIEDLKKTKIDDHFVQYCIGEYKPAIITDTLFSFFHFTEKEAYLIIIDKRSNFNSELRRYNFYRLLDNYGKGKIVASSSTFPSQQIKNSVNLTNVLIKQGQAFILELFQFHTEFDDSQDWWYFILGIKTIWLTPIYPSPWKDYGYDISNFCDIDPRFGTLDDFR